MNDDGSKVLGYATPKQQPGLRLKINLFGWRSLIALLFLLVLGALSLISYFQLASWW